MKNFKLLLPNGNVITNATVINSGKTVINSNADLCKLIKNIWKKETCSTSFTEWATSLNESGEYEGTFTKYDALDNLCSLFQLNINGQHVNLYSFFTDNLPFTNN